MEQQTIESQRLGGSGGNDPETRARRWRVTKGGLAVALLAFAGVVIMLYPSAASWVSQYQQSQLLISMEQTFEHSAGQPVEQGGPDPIGEELARAHEYNDALTGGAIVASGQNVPLSDGAGDARFDYSSLLKANDEGVMGRLRVAAISLDLPIYHGTSDDTLEKGVGHLEGTALPIGGESTHSVLTAHRGLPTAELFDRLDEVEVGDTFAIEVLGQVTVYRVIGTEVVQPDQTESLLPQYGRDLVTLVTCTPLGINSHRILVTGERITPTPVEDIERAGSVPDIPGFPWWAVGIAAAGLLLGAGVWRAGANPPPRE